MVLGVVIIPLFLGQWFLAYVYAGILCCDVICVWVGCALRQGGAITEACWATPGMATTVCVILLHKGLCVQSLYVKAGCAHCAMWL